MPFGLTNEENRALTRLRTPHRIQDFIEALPIPLIQREDRCRSPRVALRERAAFCVEGAMLAALALRLAGHRPVLLDLTSAPHDEDHVVALFRERGRWGAISKTNHATLRYRDPLYRSVRELAASYFHEYVDARGRKTLRFWAGPVGLTRFDRRGWMTSEEDVWYVPEHLALVAHRPFLARGQHRRLRPADPVEMAAGKLTTWGRRGRVL